jgi:glycosyltransferase involved in cell wall biosynthesis
MGRHFRVVHATPTYFSPHSVVGGGERYVTNLVRALATVPMIAGRPLDQEVVAVSDAPGEARVEGVTLRLLANENAQGGAMAAIPSGFEKAIAGADLVHVHQSLTPFGAFAAARARTLGLGVVATDLGGGRDGTPVLGCGMAGLWDGVLSISRYAERLLGPGAARRCVAIGPVDTEAFSPGPAPPAPAPPSLIAVGRLLPHKGVDRILRALPAALPLTVVGRPLHRDYARLLARLARGKHVVFVHDADDARLLGLYRAASLFVQASTPVDVYGGRTTRAELMGFTALEAMACGLPVLLSNTASFPELAGDPACSRVFDDEAGLAAALAEHAAGAWPPPDASGRARARAVGLHGMAEIGRQVAGFYGELACAS